jgi:hypothetical protein
MLTTGHGTQTGGLSAAHTPDPPGQLRAVSSFDFNVSLIQAGTEWNAASVDKFFVAERSLVVEKIDATGTLTSATGCVNVGMCPRALTSAPEMRTTAHGAQTGGPSGGGGGERRKGPTTGAWNDASMYVSAPAAGFYSLLQKTQHD